MDSGNKAIPPSSEIPQSLQAALEEGEFEYRNLVEMCSDLIWSVDAAGRWTFLNRKATQLIYGREPEEMLGSLFTDFESPERATSDWEAFEKVKSGIPYFKYETVHLRKDGSEVHLSFNAFVRRDAEGNVIGSVGTAIDITEQKKRGALLQEKSDLLARQQGALFKLSKMDFSDFAPSLRAILETSAEILGLERVSCWFFNADHSEIVCEDLYTRSLRKHAAGYDLKAQDYPRYFKALEENLLIACEDARQDPRTNEFTENYLIPHGIQSMMDAPIRLGGKVIGVLCHEHVGERRVWKEEEQDFITSTSSLVAIACLISRLGKTQDALREKTRELQRSNKALEEFAYIASHDLQEPLYIITSFLDNIRSQHASSLAPPVSRILGRINNAALRMTHLIADLLHYSRVNSRKKRFEEVDLNEVVQQAWQDLELRASQAKAKLELVPLPVLCADKLQMGQLFSNLLSNALKFKSKSEESRIRISGKRLPGPAAEITVEDNGIGFEAEYAEKIFQPFQRLHSKSEYEGSGMGLTICRKIVERHHGSMRAESQKGKGSRFIITLPIEAESEG